MFNDRNTGSQRRKREDQQVELRRQRTEELLNKKRASSQTHGQGASFEVLKARLFSPILEEIYKAAYECRTSLSVEFSPPIQQVVDAGIIPRCAALLALDFYQAMGDSSVAQSRELINKIRVEAAWIITNVASGTSEQTEYVVEQGVVPLLVAMLCEEDDTIIDQSVWALGNIAGDSECMRDNVLAHNALPIVIKLIEKYQVAKEHIKILRNLTWLISNLSRGRNPPPTVEGMQLTLPVIDRLVQINDADVVADCFWCLSYIVDVDAGLTDAVLRSAVMQRCLDLLSAFSASLTNRGGEVLLASGRPHDQAAARIGAVAICPIIRMLGNIVTGTDEATDAVLSQGFLSFFQSIFYGYENKKLPRIRKEMCWLLSNVTAGTPAQVRYVVESDLVNLLIDAVSRYELYVRREACYAIMNILHFCSKNPEYLQRLLDNQVVQALQSHLEAVSNAPEMQAHILDAVRYALEAGEKIRAKLGENPVVQIMIDCKIVDEIEELQDTHNTVVVQKAYNIIVDFFEGEDE